jgi:phosphomannomutase
VPVDAETGVDAARISAAARLDALRDGIKTAAAI